MSSPWVRHEHPTLEAAENHRRHFNEVTDSIGEIRFDEQKQVYFFSTKYWGCE